MDHVKIRAAGIVLAIIAVIALAHRHPVSASPCLPSKIHDSVISLTAASPAATPATGKPRVVTKVPRIVPTVRCEALWAYVFTPMPPAGNDAADPSFFGPFMTLVRTMPADQFCNHFSYSMSLNADMHAPFYYGRLRYWGTGGYARDWVQSPICWTTVPSVPTGTQMYRSLQFDLSDSAIAQQLKVTAAHVGFDQPKAVRIPSGDMNAHWLDATHLTFSVTP